MKAFFKWLFGQWLGFVVAFILLGSMALIVLGEYDPMDMPEANEEILFGLKAFLVFALACVGYLLVHLYNKEKK